MATIENKASFEVPKQFIRELVENEIKRRIEVMYDEMKADLVKRIDREKTEACAAVLVECMGMVDMNIMQDRVVFTIRQSKT